MKSDICTEKTRDYLFDNYKAFLIFMVVLGHFVELASDDNLFLECVKWMVFSFHMPAFVFVSGYFSKKKSSFLKLIRRLMVPYLVFEVLYYLLYVYVIHKKTHLWLFWPKFTLWYLPAMFVWKLVIPYYRKIPGHLPIAVAIGLFAGCLGIDDNFLTLPRLMVFFPFFVIGADFKREYITAIRNKISPRFAALSLFCVNLFVAAVAIWDEIPVFVFYGRYNYDYLHEENTEGIAIRFLFYCIAFLLNLLYLSVMSEQKSRFTLLGERTMAVYLFHGLVYGLIAYLWEDLPEMNLVVQSLLIVLLVVGVTWLLSRKPFTIVLDWITKASFCKGKIACNKNSN